MRLHRLHLLNFRQHADTDLVFGPGITGIIGPNGSGKTTLLEAIAWAIYGNAAARGDKDSIRNFRAKARSSVRVELEFGVGAHEYKVVRGLHAAELYQDGQLVANSLTEVTAKLERGLGMSHDEFFNTYFTGQKDLAVMAKLTRPERAAFLSRVLRYEQLSIAQQRIREEKNALAAELHGREAGLPERATIEGERAAAGLRLEQAQRAAAQAQAARGAAQEADAREAPRWKEWVEKEKRGHSLGGDRRVGGQAGAGAGKGGARPGPGGGGGAGGARRSGARGAGTHRAARGRRAGRRGATRRVGPGKGIRQHAPRRPAEAVRRSQGATGQDRAARARRDVPDVPATARQRVRGGAGHPRPPDAGDRGRRQVFPATPRAAGPAARGGDRRGGGTRSTVGRKPPGERARRRAARPERGARPRGRATSWPPDPGPGARRVDSRAADRLRPAATRHGPGRAHEARAGGARGGETRRAGEAGGDPGQGSRARRAGAVRARAAGAAARPTPGGPGGFRGRAAGGAGSDQTPGRGGAGGGG